MRQFLGPLGYSDVKNSLKHTIQLEHYSVKAHNSMNRTTQFSETRHQLPPFQKLRSPWPSSFALLDGGDERQIGQRLRGHVRRYFIFERRDLQDD